MTKKMTPAAIALMNAARTGGAGAMRAAIDEIVKDAPPIPGLAELEEKYGTGNIPMTAVHESATLSLKDKKFLFNIAGFEYDGTIHKTVVSEAFAAFSESFDVSYPQTPEAYEQAIYTMTAFALAGHPESISRAAAAQRDELLSWGLYEFPDFKLSAKRVADALEMATALRGTLNAARKK